MMNDAWVFFIGLWAGIGVTLGVLTLATRRMERTHYWVSKKDVKWWEMLDWSEFDLEYIEKLPEPVKEYALAYRSLSEKANKEVT
jgi:hypothetical protein